MVDKTRIENEAMTLVGVDALCFYQCFDTVGSVMEEHPAHTKPVPCIQKVCFSNK